MKYYIITYGCQMNVSDSQRIAQYLEKKGYLPASYEALADLIVVNMCSVRQSAVDRAYAKVRHLCHCEEPRGAAEGRRGNPIVRQPSLVNDKKRVILTGCILKTDKKKFETLGAKIKIFNQLPLPCRLKLEKKPSGHNQPAAITPSPRHLVGLVPIMHGCNNFCSYCVVPWTRGREWSRPVRDIIKEVKAFIKHGCREIVLLGQNVNSYNNRRDRPYACPLAPKSERRIPKNGRPQEPAPYLLRGSPLQEILDFADLLKIINSLPGDFKIRFLTSHPKDMSDKLIKTIGQCDKVIKEIHLPVQAGDNETLQRMNRGYTRQQYLDLVKKIKLKIPGVRLTTDIIVGFPEETKKQFQKTISLVKKVGLFKAYIAKYSPRPGTAAAKLPDNIPPAEKKRREQILRNLLKYCYKP